MAQVRFRCSSWSPHMSMTTERLRRAHDSRPDSYSRRTRSACRLAAGRSAALHSAWWRRVVRLGASTAISATHTHGLGQKAPASRARLTSFTAPAVVDRVARRRPRTVRTLEPRRAVPAPRAAVLRCGPGLPRCPATFFVAWKTWPTSALKCRCCAEHGAAGHAGCATNDAAGCATNAEHGGADAFGALTFGVSRGGCG